MASKPRGWLNVVALSLICSRRGWFPFSYTRVISDGEGASMKQLRVHKYVLGCPSRSRSVTVSRQVLTACCRPVCSSLHGKSSSTGNLLEREDVAAPVPDYSIHPRMAAQTAAALHGRQQRPYSMAVPGFSQVGSLQNTHTRRHPPT